MIEKWKLKKIEKYWLIAKVENRKKSKKYLLSSQYCSIAINYGWFTRGHCNVPYALANENHGALQFFKNVCEW